MIAEAIQKILGLAPPNEIEHEGLTYIDKTMHRLEEPIAKAVECSTLQGLVDLYANDLDSAKKTDDLFVHIVSPTEVELISSSSDLYGRRRVWATATYPKGCNTFPFNAFLDTEKFIIQAQTGFQRVMVQKDDGSYAQDLDYVLRIASGISAEAIQTADDDGISQRITARSGVVLKDQQNLKPRVNLAPYRTFAEIDQVLSGFVFRAQQDAGGVKLALFENDGGRWRLDAVAAIKAWFSGKIDLPVIC
jgi:hypothetical protein